MSAQATGDRFAVDGPAVITGGSKGIGRAIAERFAADGADVAICSRTDEEIEAAAAEIDDAHPGSAVGVACDVRDREAVEAFVETAVKRFGGIDVLVNNAGASFTAGFDDISTNGWETILDVNLTGTVHCCQAASDHMAGGAVVNLSSLAGQQGAPYMSHYGAAKAGIENLTRTLAYEWADRDIRVNCIAPGYVATPGVESQLGVSPGEIDRESIDRTVGLPEEIADLARFLASDAASFLTGETVTPRGVPDIMETPET